MDKKINFYEFDISNFGNIIGKECVSGTGAKGILVGYNMFDNLFIIGILINNNKDSWDCIDYVDEIFVHSTIIKGYWYAAAITLV